MKLTSPGHRFAVGEMVTVVGLSGSRWKRLCRLIRRPRVQVVSNVTATTFELTFRRPTWREWRAELWNILFGRLK